MSKLPCAKGILRRFKWLIIDEGCNPFPCPRWHGRHLHLIKDKLEWKTTQADTEINVSWSWPFYLSLGATCMPCVCVSKHAHLIRRIYWRLIAFWPVYVPFQILSPHRMLIEHTLLSSLVVVNCQGFELDGAIPEYQLPIVMLSLSHAKGACNLWH